MNFLLFDEKNIPYFDDNGPSKYKVTIDPFDSISILKENIKVYERCKYYHDDKFIH